MTNPIEPYDAETLQKLAEKEASALGVPDEWREDALSEFILGALESVASAESSVRTLMVSSGRNRMLDFWKRESRRGRLTPGACVKGKTESGRSAAIQVSLDLPVPDMNGEDTVLAETIPDPKAETPLAALLREERAVAVRNAMERLDPVAREAARRVFMEGETQEEAAPAMGITRQQLRTHLARARALLCEQLAEYADDLNE